MRPSRFRRGFTLIELLLVIGIIAILASIVIVAINPTRQLGQGRDTRRRSDVTTILNAVYQYAIDHQGTLPGTGSTNIPTGTPKYICKYNAASCSNGVKLDVLAQSGTYLVSIPTDPRASATGTGTNYTIMQDTNGRVTVAAPGGEQDANITVTR